MTSKMPIDTLDLTTTDTPLIFDVSRFKSCSVQAVAVGATDFVLTLTVSLGRDNFVALSPAVTLLATAATTEGSVIAAHIDTSDLMFLQVAVTTPDTVATIASINLAGDTLT